MNQCRLDFISLHFSPSSPSSPSPAVSNTTRSEKSSARSTLFPPCTGFPTRSAPPPNPATCFSPLPYGQALLNASLSFPKTPLTHGPTSPRPSPSAAEQSSSSSNATPPSSPPNFLFPLISSPLFCVGKNLYFFFAPSFFWSAPGFSFSPSGVGCRTLSPKAPVLGGSPHASCKPLFSRSFSEPPSNLPGFIPAPSPAID